MTAETQFTFASFTAMAQLAGDLWQKVDFSDADQSLLWTTAFRSAGGQPCRAPRPAA
jgi:hypothetical protein